MRSTVAFFLCLSGLMFGAAAPALAWDCEDYEGDFCETFEYEKLERFDDPTMDTSGWLTSFQDAETGRWTVVVNTRLAPNKGLIAKDQEKKVWESQTQLRNYIATLTGVPAPTDTANAPLLNFDYIQKGHAWSVTEEGPTAVQSNHHFMIGIITGEDGVVRIPGGAIPPLLLNPGNCVQHHATDGVDTLEATQCSAVQPGDAYRASTLETRIKSFGWNGVYHGFNLEEFGIIRWRGVLADFMSIESDHYDNDGNAQVTGWYDEDYYTGFLKLSHGRWACPGGGSGCYQWLVHLDAICSIGEVRRGDLSSFESSEAGSTIDPTGAKCID